jgi:hypothetical protein
MFGNKMVTAMICGYYGHGKDRVLDDLIHEQFTNNWYVYGPPQNNDYKWMGTTNFKRVAFADELKRDVISKYNLSPDIEKSDTVYVNYKYQTYRDLLICEAKMNRMIDPDIYCKRAFDNVEHKNVFVTDWRYPNEYKYVTDNINLNTVTLRVFRKDAKSGIPDSSIESEHSLDRFLTDFLILAKNEVQPFRASISFFPQYRDYVKLV